MAALASHSFLSKKMQMGPLELPADLLESVEWAAFHPSFI
jgi:hypothetical protein